MALVKFLIGIIMLIVVTGGTEFLVYKHMRKIDRKERERLQAWEYEYVESLEKKIKELEKEKKK